MEMLKEKNLIFMKIDEVPTSSEQLIKLPESSSAIENDRVLMMHTKMITCLIIKMTDYQNLYQFAISNYF